MRGAPWPLVPLRKNDGVPINLYGLARRMRWVLVAWRWLLPRFQSPTTLLSPRVVAPPRVARPPDHEAAAARLCAAAAGVWAAAGVLQRRRPNLSFPIGRPFAVPPRLLPPAPVISKRCTLDARFALCLWLSLIVHTAFVTFSQLFSEPGRLMWRERWFKLVPFRPEGLKFATSASAEPQTSREFLQRQRKCPLLDHQYQLEIHP